MYGELALMFGIGFLGVLSGAFGVYVIVKRTLKDIDFIEISEEIFTNILEKAQNDKEIQQKLYIVGGILGQGIASGIGLKGGQKQGKFNIGNLIMGFLGQKFQLPTGEEQPQQSDIGLP